MRCQVTKAVLTLTFFACVLPGAEKKAIYPPGASKGGVLTPAILVDGTLYLSGQLGRDASGKIPEEFEAEVKQLFANAAAILKEAGMSFDDVVSAQVYLTDMELFQRMNAVYGTYFKDVKPTRTTVGVAKLVGTARIEITMTARK